MTKKRVVLNDITGEELKEGEYLEVQIEKPGYLFEIDGGSKTNVLIMHVKEADLDKIKSKIKTVKSELPPLKG